MQESKTARIIFDTHRSAAKGLITVLRDARTTDMIYKFSPLTLKQILLSGLVLTGEIDAVLAKLKKNSGAVAHIE